MTLRSPLLAVAAISFACSSAHQIGTETPMETGTTGGSAGASSVGSVGGGSGSSTGGASSNGGASVSSSSTVVGSGGSSGSVGGTSGGGTGGSGIGGAVADAGDAAPVGPADAGADGIVPADGGGGPFPPRVVFFYTPLGTLLPSWRPTPAGMGFNLSLILQPLEPFKNRLLIVDGIDSLIRSGVPTSTDQSGPALLLTGKGSADPSLPGGPSLATLLGQTLGETAFRSVQLGVQSSVAIDYDSGGGPQPTSNNPAQAAARLLGGMPMPGVQFSNTTDFIMAGRQMMDLVRLSLQYDRTRVISLSWGDVNGTTLFNWIAGIDKSYGALAANSGVAGLDRDHFIAAQTWFAQQFAYLLNALATTPEGNGSLLDHTLVLWVSETGEASLKTGKNIPVVIAGNLLGRFRNGAYVQTTGSQLNLLSTIAQVAGVTTPFGDPALGSAPIAALLNP